MKPKAAGTSKWSVKAMSRQQVCGVCSFMIDGWREQADSLVVGGGGGLSWCTDADDLKDWPLKKGPDQISPDTVFHGAIAWITRPVMAKLAINALLSVDELCEIFLLGMIGIFQLMYTGGFTSFKRIHTGQQFFKMQQIFR